MMLKRATGDKEDEGTIEELDISRWCGGYQKNATCAKMSSMVTYGYTKCWSDTGTFLLVPSILCIRVNRVHFLNVVDKKTCKVAIYVYFLMQLRCM